MLTRLASENLPANQVTHWHHLQSTSYLTLLPNANETIYKKTIRPMGILTVGLANPPAQPAAPPPPVPRRDSARRGAWSPRPPPGRCFGAPRRPRRWRPAAAPRRRNGKTVASNSQKCSFGCGSKIQPPGDRRFCPGFHLPGFHVGYPFLTYGHIWPFPHEMQTILSESI